MYIINSKKTSLCLGWLLFLYNLHNQLLVWKKSILAVTVDVYDSKLYSSMHYLANITCTLKESKKCLSHQYTFIMETSLHGWA